MLLLLIHVRFSNFIKSFSILISYNFLYLLESYLNCITPDNTKGLCKPIKQCDTAIKLLQSKPLTDQNKEYLRKMKCKEDVQPWVCCPMPVRKSGILPKAPACGIETEDRIVGGEETKINEFPWIALLGYDKCEFN